MRFLSVIVVLAVVLVAAVSPAYAGGRIVLNPQVGVNAARLDTDPEETDSKGRVGWQAGVFLRFGEGFYLQPGAFYQRTGTKLEGKDGLTFDGVKDNADVTAVYVPVLIGLDVIGKPEFTLRLNGGVSGTIVTDVAENDFGLTRDDYKKVVGGAVGGVGVDFGILTIDGSVEFGLTDVFEDDASKAKNTVARLTVGLKL